MKRPWPTARTFFFSGESEESSERPGAGYGLWGEIWGLDLLNTKTEY
jgi:hypothetical protein